MSNPLYRLKAQLKYEQQQVDRAIQNLWHKQNLKPDPCPHLSVQQIESEIADHRFNVIQLQALIQTLDKSNNTAAA
jgi:hypothetical protein